MLPVLSGLKKTALDLLFPLRCIECGKEGSLICPACHNRLAWILPPICNFCGVDKPPDTPCTNCPVFRTAIDVSVRRSDLKVLFVLLCIN
jgi:hypothetical protein